MNDYQNYAAGKAEHEAAELARREKAGHLDLAGALEKAAGLALANNAERAKCSTDSECEGL